MKIIKSLLLLTTGLFTTTLLLAQELKTESLKPAEIKRPPIAANKPSPTPEIKPQAGIVVKQSPVAASETPSVLKKDKNSTQIEDSKTQILERDLQAATSKLSAENLKTLNGTAEKPKQLTPIITTAPVSKPVVAKAPGNL